MCRVLFELPLFGNTLPVYGYGLFLGLSFVVGWHLAAHFASKEGMPVAKLKNIVFVTILGAVFFARVAYFLTNPDAWRGVGGFVRLWDGGLVAYGGFIGGIATAYAGFRVARLDFWLFAENAAPSLALGVMLTRIGCLLNGCDYGAVSDVAWALSFPRGSPPWEHHVDTGRITAEALRSLPVHPTQIYESLYGLAIFLFLLRARRFPRIFAGQSLMLFLGIYGVLRFANEYLRDDPERGHFGPFSTSQWIALATTGFAAMYTVYRVRRVRRG